MKTANLPMANRMPPLAPRALRTANRPRRRRGQRSLDATQWNRGSTSGILCAREKLPQSAGQRTPKAQAALGASPEGVALQRKRRVTRRPTQQQSRFCQSLPPNGSGFSGVTNRLRSLSESRTRSWAGGGGPRFHFVASRLRLLRLLQRALGHSSAEWTVRAIQLDGGRRIHNGLRARNTAKVDLKS